MSRQATPRDVCEYFRAGYSAIVLNTVEEVRTVVSLHAVAAEEGASLWVCSVTEGMIRMSSGRLTQNAQSSDDAPAAAERLQVQDMIEVFDQIMTRKGKGKEWFVILDAHNWVNNDPLAQRKMRDMIHRLGATTRRVIFVQPGWTVPSDLEREVTIMDLGLPDFDELVGKLDEIVGVYRKAIDEKTARGEMVEPYSLPETRDEREGLVEAARGLTVLEAENAYSRSFQKLRRFDRELVNEDKMQVVRKGGLIEIVRSMGDLNRVGGHDILKRDLMIRRRAFDAEARTYGLDSPRGCLCVGHPGTGKSLIAKCIAATWGFVLVRVDLGSVYGGVIGESEANMRRVISILDKLGRVVVWLDEIDKGLAQPEGAIAGGGEVTKHVLGIFITWMQEKATPTYCFATANDVDALPAELLRAGRFDKVYFSGMPELHERGEITGIILQERKRSPKKYGLSEIAAETSGFVGSEIEQIVKDAMNVAFSESREFTTDDIITQAHGFTPLSKTMSHVFAKREAWAKNRATPTSSRAKVATDIGNGERNVEV